MANGDHAQKRRASAAINELGLGEQAEKVAPASRQVLVMGGPSSGKTTFIRRLKYSYDGCEDAEGRRARAAAAARRARRRRARGGMPSGRARAGARPGRAQPTSSGSLR